MEKVEVVRRVRENLIKDYPLSAMELAEAVREQYPRARQHRVWDVIRENGLKEDRAYSAYNFRNKKQEDEFNASGYVPPATPSIYNSDAVDFVVNVLRNDDGDA